MNRINGFLLGLLLVLSTTVVHAQKDRNMGIIKSALVGVEYEIKAGFNIGGTSPLPLPSEIRKINSYRPDLALSLGTNITKWLNKNHTIGFTFGVMVETKAMKTDATVKNYGMAIIQEGEVMQGMWTGKVKTKFRTSYLTFPIMAAFKVSPRWKVKTGPFFSVAIERGFSGHVYEGYLREGDPTGSKVEFTGDSKAYYDFSNNLRKFQWGILVGGEWRAFKHLSVYADLNWGLNNIFQRDFDTINFNMYPIYLNMGFAYNF